MMSGLDYIYKQTEPDELRRLDLQGVRDIAELLRFGAEARGFVAGPLRRKVSKSGVVTWYRMLCVRG